MTIAEIDLRLGFCSQFCQRDLLKTFTFKICRTIVKLGSNFSLNRCVYPSEQDRHEGRECHRPSLLVLRE
jgi:hypothetical protein